MTQKTPSTDPTAALVIIGDEILSGRTQDANLAYLAKVLGGKGISLTEVRVVPDREDRIIAAVNELRARVDYLFTTGGIGPTHDDITAAAIARALGLAFGPHKEAWARLDARYGPGEFNSFRQRMAMTPHGASLIDNPLSIAPGFRIENVYVLAGVPKIMRAMLDGLIDSLAGGRVTRARAWRTILGEGVIAASLAAIQGRFPGVAIGSYPSYGDHGGAGVAVVLRSADDIALAAAADAVGAELTNLGDDPVAIDPNTSATVQES